jgi:hypothetical protein
MKAEKFSQIIRMLNECNDVRLCKVILTDQSYKEYCIFNLKKLKGSERNFNDHVSK